MSTSNAEGIIRPTFSRHTSMSSVCSPTASQQPLVFINTVVKIKASTSQYPAGSPVMASPFMGADGSPGPGPGGKKPRRKTISQFQTEELIQMYEESQSPNMTTREQVGGKIGMTQREVQIWSQDRRAKMIRQRALDFAVAPMQDTQTFSHHPMIDKATPQHLLRAQNAEEERGRSTPLYPAAFSSAPRPALRALPSSSPLVSQARCFTSSLTSQASQAGPMRRNGPPPVFAATSYPFLPYPARASSSTFLPFAPYSSNNTRPFAPPPPPTRRSTKFGSAPMTSSPFTLRLTTPFARHRSSPARDALIRLAPIKTVVDNSVMSDYHLTNPVKLPSLAAVLTGIHASTCHNTSASPSFNIFAPRSNTIRTLSSLQPRPLIRRPIESEESIGLGMLKMEGEGVIVRNIATKSEQAREGFYEAGRRMSRCI